MTVEMSDVRWSRSASPLVFQEAGDHGTAANVRGLDVMSPLTLANVTALSESCPWTTSVVTTVLVSSA